MKEKQTDTIDSVENIGCISIQSCVIVYSTQGLVIVIALVLEITRESSTFFL